MVDPMASAAQIRELSPTATLYSSVDKMLASEEPDVVHVCTPPSTHGTLIRACLEAGANVYVEKPVCERTDELEDLLLLAASRGLRICAGHQLLRHPAMDRFRSRLPALGKAVHFDSYFAFRKVRKNLTLAGQAIDILPHPTYLLVEALQLAAPDNRIELEAMQCTVGGEVRALLRAGDVTATLRVTLAGRPVDHFLRATGTNGSLNADFVRGTLTRLEGPGAGFLPMITIPFSEGYQIWVGALWSLFDRVRGRDGAYPGLRQIVQEFYDAIRSVGEAPTRAPGIRSTVEICERIGEELTRLESVTDQLALVRLESSPPCPNGPRILVTGGRGFLGRVVVETLVKADFRVRVASRTVPSPSERVPGAEYQAVDLARPLSGSVLADVDAVVHCAAASDPGEAAHQRGTVDSTSNLLVAMRDSGLKRLIHISSLAVLQPSKRGRLVTEQSAVDRGNKARGPYVWAKAEAEALVSEAHGTGTIDARIVRPGPIVDYSAWEPPGRLGRDLGSVFVAVGSPSDKIAVVQVQSVARVVLTTLRRFPSAPLLVNLVEPDAPTRRDLVTRCTSAKPGLRQFWIPSWLMAIASPVAVLAQRIVLGSKNPINLAAAFSTEKYDTTVARSLLSGTSEN